MKKIIISGIIVILLLLVMVMGTFYQSNLVWEDDFTGPRMNQTFWTNNTGIHNCAGTSNIQTTQLNGYMDVNASSSGCLNANLINQFRSNFNYNISSLNTYRISTDFNLTNTYGIGMDYIGFYISNNTVISPVIPGGNFIDMGGNGIHNLNTQSSIPRQTYRLILDIANRNATIFNESGSWLDSKILNVTGDWFPAYNILGTGINSGDTSFKLFNVSSELFEPVIFHTPSNGSFTISKSLNTTIRGTSTVSGRTLTVLAATMMLFNESGGNVNNSLDVIGAIRSSYNRSFDNIELGQTYMYTALVSTAEGVFSPKFNSSFTYGLQQDSQSFDPNVLESSINDFSINITAVSEVISVSAELIYNNTPITATVTPQGNNKFNITAIANAPSIKSNQNVNFFWNITLSDGVVENPVQSSTQSQAITLLQDVIIATSCSTGFFPSRTFDFASEENLTAINSDLEYNIQYGAGGNRTSNVVSGNFTDISTFSICINETIDDYEIGEAEFQFGRNDFVEERFYLFPGVMLSNNTQTNQTLLNLEALQATSFLINVEELTLQPLPDHFVSLLRWYPADNEFKIAEVSKTNEDGEAVVKVVEEDVDYRFGIYNPSGILIHLSDPTRMVCLVDPCTFDVFVESSAQTDINLGVQTNLTYNNNTKIFRLEYSDPSQLTDLMNLTVYRELPSGSLVVCSSSSTSFTGILLCDASGQTGILRAVVSRQASPPITLVTLLIDTSQKISDIVGGNTTLIAFWFIGGFLALVGAFINPILAIVFAISSFFPAFLLGSLPLQIFTGIIIFLLIGVHFIRRNRE